LLAALRWMAAIVAAARRLDPEAALDVIAHAFLIRREIEGLFELPSSGAIARDMLDVIGPLAAMPERLDRLLSQATDRHYRLPVELREAPPDRAARRDQRRLIGVALFWVGCALLLLVPRALGGWAAGIVAAALWAMAACCAITFLILWRRLA
jgi:hypothetical protein